MQKGLTLIPILVTTLILAAFFAPIPFRYEQTTCACPMVYPNQCPPCPRELTLGWNPSIAQTLYKKIQIKKMDPPDDTDGVERKFCGGIAANLPEYQCPKGYKCQLDGNYPDASGECIKL